MNNFESSELIFIKFISYASISFRAEIYANRLSIDWGNGEITTYQEENGYFNLRHRCQTEGLQQITISGENITYVKINKLCITDIQFSNCRNLEYLDCSGNELMSLDLSQCPQIEELHCNSNNLSKFSLSRPDKLIQLNLSYNQIEELELEGCQHLQSLECDHNKISNIKISGCTSLTKLNISDNLLEECSIIHLFDSLPGKSENDFVIIRYHRNPGTKSGRKLMFKNKNWC